MSEMINNAIDWIISRLMKLKTKDAQTIQIPLTIEEARIVYSYTILNTGVMYGDTMEDFIIKLQDMLRATGVIEQHQIDYSNTQRIREAKHKAEQKRIRDSYEK